MSEKKVLILAYDFPPYNSIASQRPASWYKYFERFGLIPTVVTLHWDNEITDDQSYIIPSFNNQVAINGSGSSRVVRVPFVPNLRDKLLYKHGFKKYAIIRKLLTINYYLLRFLFLKADNTRQIYYESFKLLKKEKFALVIATGEPFILFKYANKLSREFNIPWIADYRDVWTNNHIFKHSGLVFYLINRFYFRSLEVKYLKSCKAITVSTPSYVKQINQILSNKEIEVINNGFEIEDIDAINNIQQNDKYLEIAYAGRIYPYQQLEVFLAGFKAFINLQNHQIKVKVIFYGLNFYPDNKKRVLAFDQTINKYIEFTDRISYQSTIENLRKANILLLLSNKGMDVIPGKFYDYIAVNRKVFLVTDDKGILSEMILKCEAGDIFENYQQVSKRLKELYDEFKQYQKIQHQSKNTSEYSREYQAKRLSQYIRTCVE